MHRIELSPNASLSWQMAAVFFASIAAASLFIALIFVAQGFWPILPFAGLELSALGWALWHSLRKSRQRDTVVLDPERVVVEKHRLNGLQRVEFPRFWTRVRLEPAAHRNHPSRLVLAAHGRSCEIGDFLTDDERSSLQLRLSQLLSGAAGSHEGKRLQV